jgi:acyl-CoA oxidase
MTDKGFFQEHGRLSSGRTKQITREVNRLCNEVRLVAGELVDAFGIPDAVLGAPIGVAGPAGARRIQQADLWMEIAL